MRQIVVVGGSGLVGSAVLGKAAALGHPVPVKALVRRLMPTLPATVEQVVVAELTDAATLAQHIPQGSWVFCCVGTTMRKAGTQQGFRAVDLDIPVALAEAAHMAGAAGLSVVSSAGASTQAFFFYTRTKGEMEMNLQAQNLPALHIFRPGFLVGNRADRRLGETLAIWISLMFKPVFIGPLAAYAPITADKLAAKMLDKALKGLPGLHIYEGGLLTK